MRMVKSERDQLPVQSGESEVILILSPIGRDGTLASEVLRVAGFETIVCSDITHLCNQIVAGNSEQYAVGVILIAEEALVFGKEQDLIDLLDKQPPWSDIPIILLTSGGESKEANLRALDVFGSSGNVTLLERPLKTITLISAIHVALRSRRGQYEIKDLLEQREAALLTISAAREEAEGANRMKDQFLATLSHELRTPLNAILGWGQILSEELTMEDKIHDIVTLKQGVEVIERNARAQAKLIEDLLDVSRIISGKLLLDHKPIDMAKVLIAARDAVTPQAEAKGIVLEMSIEALLPSVLGDAARLQQIVWNLLSNAVKFTPAGGKIILDLHRMGEDLRIVIRDTGQGMSPEFLPFIFERFRQADETTTRKHGGLGLGLSIVRHLVKLHQGKVTAESEGPGKGSTFILTFPTTAIPENGFTPAHSSDKYFDPTRKENNRKLDGIRVLVVDNEPDARDLVKRLLVEEHADVEVAGSVSEAMAVVKIYKPDILISDIGMPDEDGYDLIRRIRESSDDISKIPAVALTAYASTEDKKRAKLAGFQLHLAKPVNPNELRSTVASLI